MKTSMIKILGSGSSGNCLAIYNSSGKYIIVDVGMSSKDILRGVDFNLTNCLSMLCTHNHTDHTKSLDYFINMGIPCYGNKDVCDHHKGCNLLSKVLKVDGFKVQNFDLVHDVPCSAFVIDIDDNVRILYCTDTKYIPKRVKGVHFAIIECNHDAEYMLDKALEDKYYTSKPENHQSLDTCTEYLKQIQSPNLQAIILWHLSNGNIDEIASLFTAVLLKSNDCDLITFADNASYRIVNPDDSVMTIKNAIKYASGGTNFESVFRVANKKYDRVILLSDMQAWVQNSWWVKSPKAAYEWYKKQYNAPDCKFYSIDLAGYGTMQMPQRDVYCLAGFSEKIFDLMKHFESDKNALITAINSVEL